MRKLSISHDGESKKIVVIFRNVPTKLANNVLFESILSLEEGKPKEWGNGYKYRIDRRPAHMGGDQLHIYNRHGQSWAYRYNGFKSEPNKYTSRATNVVKDIISYIFKIDKSTIEETLITNVSDEEIVIDVIFA